MLEWKKTYDKDGRQLATLTGELCLPNLNAVIDGIRLTFADANHVVIDLSAVSVIDSAGLQLLVVLKKEAANKLKKLKFINHSQAVIDCLAVFGAIGLFQDRVILHSIQDKKSKFRYGLEKQAFC